MADEAPIDSALRDLIRECVREGLAGLAAPVAGQKFIGAHFNWQTMLKPDGGFPHFYQAGYGEYPTDYKRAFRANLYEGLAGSGKPEVLVPEESLPTMPRLLEFARAHARLRRVLGAPGEESALPGWPEGTAWFHFDHQVRELVIAFIDRYMHLHKATEFDENRFMAIYLELERGHLAARLDIDILVPLLGLECSFESAPLAENIEVSRMGPELQLARVNGRRSEFLEFRGRRSGAYERASHALVLRAYELPNDSLWTARGVCSDASLLAAEVVEDCLAALRIASDCNTGYAQVLTLPKGWAWEYMADLPSVLEAKVTRYPRGFSEGEPLMPSSKLELGQVHEAGIVFEKFATSERKEYDVAKRRLNRCYLRDDEDDSLLDSTFALESLLLDDSDREGITHKLALRVAALCSSAADSPGSPHEVFSLVKQIYRARSDIVHGRSRKKRTGKQVGVQEQGKPRMLDQARQLLRIVLREMIHRPELQAPGKVDGLLLSAVEAKGKAVSPEGGPTAAEPGT